MTQVLVFSGKEAEGLRGLGQAVPVTGSPCSDATARRFWRTSS